MLRSPRASWDIPPQYNSSGIVDECGMASRINPCAIGIISSPCKRRPDTGRPCPLAGKDKDNDLCAACDIAYGGSGPSEASARAYAAVRRVATPNGRTIPYSDKKRYPVDLPPRGEECAVPGCNNPPQGLRSPFCSKCRSRVAARVQRWYASNPEAGKPPLAYLFAKKQAGFREMVW